MEAKKLNEHDLKKWVKERAKINGIIFDPDALELLITLVGTNMFMITSEVDKLSMYASGEKQIDASMVEKLVSRSLEQNIFTLIEKVVHENRKTPLEFIMIY